MKNFEDEKLNDGIKLLKDIMKDYNLSQVALGRKLSVTKSYIWQLLNGEKQVTNNVTYKLKEVFPEYFNVDKVIKDNTVQIDYCPEWNIPASKGWNSDREKIVIDRRILCREAYLNINPASCVLVTVSTDTLAPVLFKGDRVILHEKSYLEFINDQIFLFIYKNRCYLRKIVVLPDKIKCISHNNMEDTFYLNGMENVNIIGLVVPNIKM